MYSSVPVGVGLIDQIFWRSLPGLGPGFGALQHPTCVRVFSLQGCHRKLVFMSELDVAKEKIAYLKVWLGILLVTDISTFGWLVSNVDTATRLLLWAAVVVVVALTLGILFLHRRIDRHIQSLKGL